jgi:hypothetical protein
LESLARNWNRHASSREIHFCELGRDCLSIFRVSHWHFARIEKLFVKESSKVRMTSMRATPFVPWRERFVLPWFSCLRMQWPFATTFHSWQSTPSSFSPSDSLAHYLLIPRDSLPEVLHRRMLEPQQNQRIFDSDFHNPLPIAAKDTIRKCRISGLLWTSGPAEQGRWNSKETL